MLRLLAVIGIAATLASAKARRLLLLFAILASPFAFFRSYGTSPVWFYLAPAFLSLAAFFVSRRSRHKRQPDHTIGNVA